MKNLLHPLRRLAALTLALLLALGPMSGWTVLAEAPASISIGLVWNDQASFSSAAPIAAPGYENSYWLFAPEEAVWSDAWLRVSDLSGQWLRFTLPSGLEIPPEGLPLSQTGYLDAGAEPGMNYVEIAAYDAMGQAAASLRLYISLSTDTPALPGVQPQITQGAVAVRYIDAMTGAVIAETSAAVYADNGWVSADDSLAPGYERMGEPAVYVTLNPDGSCSPNPVEFHYHAAVQAAAVEVVCLDDAGNVLSSAQETHQPGASAVLAPTLPGYTLAPGVPAQVEVNVTAQGAVPSRVEFRYLRPVSAVTIPVTCVDEQGAVITSSMKECPAGTTPIIAAALEGYDLDKNYPGQVDVTITAEGANVQEVVFHYTRRVNAVTLPVT